MKLLQYFQQKHDQGIMLSTHLKTHVIIKSTAANDLKALVNKSFLTKIKHGRNMYYYPTKKISELFKYM